MKKSLQSISLVLLITTIVGFIYLKVSSNYYYDPTIILVNNILLAIGWASGVVSFLLLVLTGLDIIDIKKIISKQFNLLVHKYVFLIGTNIILVAITILLLYEICAFRNMEFISAKNVELFESKKVGVNEKIGDVPPNKIVTFRIRTGVKYFLFKEPLSSEYTSIQTTEIPPFWSGKTIERILLNPDEEFKPTNETLSLAVTNRFSQTHLKLKWGLDSTPYYRESTIPKNSYSANRLADVGKDGLYRFFTFHGTTYFSKQDNLQRRQERLWMDFIKATPDSSRTRANFAKFAKVNDPYFYGIEKSIAPRLYFHFIGLYKQYILDSIAVTTIRFGGYASSGFSDGTERYDIVLKHKPGTYIFNLTDMLRFTGSGTAILRFWSDNYYNGFTPSGVYTISIRFYFTVDGKKDSVSTGTFALDD